jgi:hypothetical protein
MVRMLRPADESEVISAFVRAERDSLRYGERVRALLEKHAGDERAVLAEHRAWGLNEGLFFGFPNNVSWYRAALTKDEVLDILYINWDWWLRITEGSRRPRDAAARMRAGLLPGAPVEDDDERIAQAAATNPELIAVRASEQDPIVLLEGHVRLTAYALFLEYLPTELELFLGESPEMAGWSEY